MTPIELTELEQALWRNTEAALSAIDERLAELRARRQDVLATAMTVLATEHGLERERITRWAVRGSLLDVELSGEHQLPPPAVPEAAPAKTPKQKQARAKRR